MSNVVTLPIRSEAEAIAHLKAALSGLYDGASVQLQFEGWPSFDVKIRGKRYEQSLPSGVMKALVQYQSTLNRAYAVIGAGRSAQSLTDEDRREVEVVFGIRKGSTESRADLYEQLTRLGEKAMERMTGKELVVTILGSALILSAYLAGTHWMDVNAATQEEETKAELYTRMLEQNERLAELNAEMAKTSMALVKGAHDADSIDIGGLTLSRDDINDLNQRRRISTVAKRIDFEYSVTQLKEAGDRWRVVLESPATGSFQTDLFKSQSAAQCIGEISTALITGGRVKLLVLARYKNESIQSASILGSEACGLLVPDQQEGQLMSNETDEDDVDS